MHLIDIQQVRDQIQAWIVERNNGCRTLVATGFHGLHVASEDPQFREILNNADLFVPDGIAPVWIARALGLKTKGRVTGSDILRDYLELANEKGYSSFFFGDTEDTLEALRENLQRQYPGHRIVGTYSPPFRQHTDAEKRQMIDMINAAQPDVLWVGLGLPKQERWIAQHRDELHVPVAIGVGAVFGFFSGKIKRVPQWIGDNGFEWVWRFLAEPKKLWRRDLLEGPRFLFSVAKDWQRIRASN